ncbi:MAG: glycosyltransferase family 4 protein [Candidatus Ratteibacteria bacterium]|nr:glycosyltransferase family 4 protein [Candidatus Ratteibacteria bacterium]
MKILHVDTETGFRGGELQVLLLMEGLKKRGHENFLAASNDLLIEKARSITESTYRIKPKKIFDVVNIFKICRFIGFSQADILHVHTAHAHLLGGIAGKIKHKPVVVTRRVDFPIKSRFKYNRLADKIIAISKAVEKILLDAGVIENKIVLISSGIDTSRFDNVKPADYLFREFNIPGKRLMIGTVAHLTDHKGHTYLLDAIPKVLKEFPHCFFLFIGDGELKDSLRTKSRIAGIRDKVFFTGFREDIPEILSILDLFILPSHLEGLCTSLMDAIYMGVPVVATTAGGIPEVVENEKTGLLVPPKDPNALAEAIIKLLKDKDKRETFAAEGKKRILEKFTASRMVEQVEQVYLSLLKS